MVPDEISNELFQLVYISERSENTNDDVIENIRLQAEKKNDLLNITGALLYNDRFFLQFIEGEPTTINKLYAAIRCDQRHINVRLLLNKPLLNRDFPSWSLGVKKFLDIEENKDLWSLLNMLGNARLVTENQIDWFKIALK